jgi:hypothetical protein
MASQFVQHQLAKQLHLNAANIVPQPPAPLPSIMLNPPRQPAYPAYFPINTNSVAHIAEPIPFRPVHGQSSQHPYQTVSEANLHPVLFQMEPYPDQFPAHVPLLVNQQTGQVEYGNRGVQHPLRYFHHLPRWIDPNVSGMLIETWLRLDPRAEMNDIVDRMNIGPGDNLPKMTTLAMRRLRFRETLGIPIFCSGRTQAAQAEIDYISTRSPEQFLLNTCMIVDLATGRLLKPVLDHDNTTVGYVDSELPLDYFLRGFNTMPIPIPSDRQIVMLELRKRLQTLALRLGYGNAPDNYHHLPQDCHPVWWHKRQDGNRVIHEIDGLTHREFMDKLFSQHPGLTKDGRQRAPVALPTPVSQPPATLHSGSFGHTPAHMLAQPAQLNSIPQIHIQPASTQVLVQPAPVTPVQQTPPQPAQPTFPPFTQPAVPNSAPLPIDPRLLDGTWIGVPLVLPYGQPDGQGGWSQYVEPIHRHAVSNETDNPQHAVEDGVSDYEME